MPRHPRNRLKNARTPATFCVDGHIIEAYHHIDDLPRLSTVPHKRPRHATRGLAAAERNRPSRTYSAAPGSASAAGAASSVALAGASLPPSAAAAPSAAGVAGASSAVTASAADANPGASTHPTPCRVCLRSSTARKIIVCSLCRKAVHTFCLNPPLIDLPTDPDWKCVKCTRVRLPLKKEKRAMLREAVTTYNTLCSEDYINSLAASVVMLTAPDASASVKRPRSSPGSPIAGVTLGDARSGPLSIDGVAGVGRHVVPNENTVVLRITNEDTDIEDDGDKSPPIPVPSTAPPKPVVSGLNGVSLREFTPTRPIRTARVSMMAPSRNPASLPYASPTQTSGDGITEGQDAEEEHDEEDGNKDKDEIIVDDRQFTNSNGANLGHDVDNENDNVDDDGDEDDEDISDSSEHDSPSDSEYEVDESPDRSPIPRSSRTRSQRLANAQTTARPGATQSSPSRRRLRPRDSKRLKELAEAARADTADHPSQSRHSRRRFRRHLSVKQSTAAKPIAKATRQTAKPKEEELSPSDSDEFIIRRPASAPAAGAAKRVSQSQYGARSQSQHQQQGQRQSAPVTHLKARPILPRPETVTDTDEIQPAEPAAARKRPIVKTENQTRAPDGKGDSDWDDDLPITHRLERAFPEHYKTYQQRKVSGKLRGDGTIRDSPAVFKPSRRPRRYAKTTRSTGDGPSQNNTDAPHVMHAEVKPQISMASKVAPAVERRDAAQVAEPKTVPDSGRSSGDVNSSWQKTHIESKQQALYALALGQKQRPRPGDTAPQATGRSSSSQDGAPTVESAKNISSATEYQRIQNMRLSALTVSSRLREASNLPVMELKGALASRNSINSILDRHSPRYGTNHRQGGTQSQSSSQANVPIQSKSTERRPADTSHPLASLPDPVPAKPMPGSRTSTQRQSGLRSPHVSTQRQLAIPSPQASIQRQPGVPSPQNSSQRHSAGPNGRSSLPRQEISPHQSLPGPSARPAFPVTTPLDIPTPLPPPNKVFPKPQPLHDLSQPQPHSRSPLPSSSELSSTQRRDTQPPPLPRLRPISDFAEDVQLRENSPYRRHINSDAPYKRFFSRNAQGLPVPDLPELPHSTDYARRAPQPPTNIPSRHSHQDHRLHPETVENVHQPRVAPQQHSPAQVHSSSRMMDLPPATTTQHEPISDRPTRSEVGVTSLGVLPTLKKRRRKMAIAGLPFSLPPPPTVPSPGPGPSQSHPPIHQPGDRNVGVGLGVNDPSVTKMGSDRRPQPIHMDASIGGPPKVSPPQQPSPGLAAMHMPPPRYTRRGSRGLDGQVNPGHIGGQSVPASIATVEMPPRFPIPPPGSLHPVPLPPSSHSYSNIPDAKFPPMQVGLETQTFRRNQRSTAYPDLHPRRNETIPPPRQVSLTPSKQEQEMMHGTAPDGRNMMTGDGGLQGLPFMGLKPVKQEGGMARRGSELPDRRTAKRTIMPYLPTAERRAQYEQGRALAFYNRPNVGGELGDGRKIEEGGVTIAPLRGRGIGSDIVGSAGEVDQQQQQQDPIDAISGDGKRRGDVMGASPSSMHTLHGGVGLRGGHVGEKYRNQGGMHSDSLTPMVQQLDERRQLENSAVAASADAGWGRAHVVGESGTGPAIGAVQSGGGRHSTDGAGGQLLGSSSAPAGRPLTRGRQQMSGPMHTDALRRDEVAGDDLATKEGASPNGMERMTNVPLMARLGNNGFSVAGGSMHGGPSSSGEGDGSRDGQGTNGSQALPSLRSHPSLRHLLS